MPILAFGEIDTKTEITTKSDKAKTPVARTTTITRNGKLLYRLFKPLDPELIGTAMAPTNESFYIDGHRILEYRRFPEFPKITFSSFEDFFVTISEEKPYSIIASSESRKISFIWTQDSEGLYTVFSEKPFPSSN